LDDNGILEIASLSLDNPDLEDLFIIVSLDLLDYEA